MSNNDPVIEKRYLGDGVYASTDNHHIILTTENGLSAYNTIYLDDSVAKNFTRFMEDFTREVEQRLMDAAAQQQEKDQA